MTAAGRLDGEAVERVLAAAGHRRRPASPPGRADHPREAEVLRLLALGLTIRQVAEQLDISAKTADHHIQHVYTKIGVLDPGGRGSLPSSRASSSPRGDQGRPRSLRWRP